MPIIHVHLLAGRPAEAKVELAKELTSVMQRTLGSDPERVHVLITEYAEGDWSLGGRPLQAGQESE
ncbi:MAG: tautomerase family protein [Dermatophilaceae bacterium]